MNKQIEIWSEEGRSLLKEIYLKRKFEKKKKIELRQDTSAFTLPHRL